jgi:GGDEF domain-containing protein
VEDRQTETLLRLGRPRSRNFSDAADSALRALSDAIPGTIVLGRLEPDEQGCRVIDARGAALDGVRRGAVLGLAGSANGDRPAAGDDHDRAPDNRILDRDSLQLLGAGAVLEVPLEMSDGRIVGVLAALGSEADAFGAEHAATVGVAARLLGHEWESVELRAELRRLRRRASAGTNVDAETGLPDRDGFLDLLDHEWRLANRGTVESVLLAFEIGPGPDRAPAGDAMDRLALKIVAEVLEGSTRVTDRVGRVGPATFATVLVGCRLDQAPAFVGRFQAALRRVTGERRPQVELSLGVQALAGAPSPEVVLKLAEAAAEAPDEQHRAPAGAGHEEASG